MGATLSRLNRFVDCVHREGGRPLKILDVGCQNLYLADAAKNCRVLPKVGPAAIQAKY